MQIFKRRTVWVAALVAVLAIALGAVTLTAVTLTAVAQQGDDDRPITPPALEQATKAALDYTGGGTVTETEVGDDGAAYGVEVRLDDGRQVEVNLDANFNVIGKEADDDGPNDQDSADDD
jgi:uncharacterized membrane protein YkoI